jgi:hypothetical protein
MIKSVENHQTHHGVMNLMRFYKPIIYSRAEAVNTLSYLH